MSVRIAIPSYLQPYTGNREVIEAQGNTVGECFNGLLQQSPGIGPMLFDKNGRLFSYVSTFVNKEDASLDGPTRTVRDGDEIHVIYIIGGG